MIEIVAEPMGRVLLVNDQPIMHCVCGHVLERVASLLRDAQNAPRRQAMHILTSDIGFCEDVAVLVLRMLHEGVGTEIPKHLH